MKHVHLLNISGETRKRFKTYVNILSTIKNEQNEKYLILRKKYIHECPDEEAFECYLGEKNTSRLSIEHDRDDISGRSIESDFDVSQLQGNSSTIHRTPLLTPPPYKPPPSVISPNHNYRLCVDEFKFALNAVDITPTSLPETALESITESSAENPSVPSCNDQTGIRTTQSNIISVREATKKFNRIASQEDASIKNSSPGNSKKSSSTKNVSQISFYQVILSVISIIHPLYVKNAMLCSAN